MTETIKLRALELSDLDILYELENEQELWPSSNSHTPYSRFTLEQFILSTQNDFYKDCQLRLVAERNGDVVGMVDLCNFIPQHGRAEVCIALVKEYRYQGLGKEVLAQLIDYVKKNLTLHQLYALVAVGNRAALNAFSSVGFVQTGLLKEWISSGNGLFSDVQVLQLKP